MDNVCPTCEALRRRIAELEAQLAQALRAGKRQAAPFAKGPPKPEPKKPGRKPGDDYGRTGHRLPPPPAHIDEIHEDDLVTFLKFPAIEATSRLAEHAIRFGVILRKIWGGNRTWAGARARAVLMSLGRTCWQQGRCALDTLSQLLRGQPVLLAQPP